MISRGPCVEGRRNAVVPGCLPAHAPRALFLELGRAAIALAAFAAWALVLAVLVA